MRKSEIKIRECLTPEEFSGCVRLQREVFNLPEIEISPVRHLIVTRHAGGFTLGAFDGDELVGFVLSVLAFKGNERMFYSHMTAIDKRYQNRGIGSKLKWAQRDRALEDGVKYIKWTFQPVQSRNAYFNLEKLGAVIREYHPNFYGTDYLSADASEFAQGIESDRLFAQWELDCPRVELLSKRIEDDTVMEVAREVSTVNDWNLLVRTNPEKAVKLQREIKYNFEEAFKDKLVCRRFQRDEKNPKYLLFRD